MEQQIINNFTEEDIGRLKRFLTLIDKPIQDAPVTLEFFRNEYEKFIKKNRSAKYLSSIQLSFNHLENYFNQQKILSSISLRDAELFVDKVKESAPSGYVVYYRNIKAAFNKAIDWGYIKSNPFKKIKLEKKQKNKPAFLNINQIEIICRHIDSEIIKDAVVLSFHTGLRLGELVNLKWKNINLEDKIITVGDYEFKTKARKQRIIPINDKVLELMNKVYNPSQVYVFSKGKKQPFTGDYFSKKFKTACRSAGISDKVHWHSLRHSFASNLVQNGVPIYVIKELLGHSSITTTEIYSHLNVDSLREAVEKLDRPTLNPPIFKGETFTNSSE